MEIPYHLKQRIDEAIAYIGNNTTDWLLVKRQLINAFPALDRSLFSARHPCTKKHSINEFDQTVINYWFEQTGVLLTIDTNKVHDPNWQHKKKGWALCLFNETRKSQREERT